VVQDGALIGIISIRDLVKHRVMAQQAEMERLRAGLVRTG
jgi:hypothetical protein